VHSTDLGLGAVAGVSAVLVIAGTFFNVFQNAIQIIGIGTAISLTLTAYKYVADTTERRRGRVVEGIARLKPEIYDPLLTWAIHAKTTLQNQIPGEFAFAVPPPPPDITSKGDFVAAIGPSLRSSIETTLESLRMYGIWTAQVRQRYSERLENLVHTLYPDRNANDCWIYFDKMSEWGVRNMVYSRDFRYIKGLLNQGTKVELSDQRLSEGGKPREAPESVLRALSDPSDLEGFPSLQGALAKLQSDLNTTIGILKVAIVKGEPDWNL
jgi:hypothetical protein